MRVCSESALVCDQGGSCFITDLDILHLMRQAHSSSCLAALLVWVTAADRAEDEETHANNNFGWLAIAVLARRKYTCSSHDGLYIMSVECLMAEYEETLVSPVHGFT